MYSILNPVEDIITEAKKFVLTGDRHLYNDFMNTIEIYCADHNVVIGGVSGISTLLGHPIDIDSYSFDLYIDDTFNHARALADALYATGQNNAEVPSDTISVESNIKHRMFSIWINNRLLIKLYKLDRYRNVKLVELIKPIPAAGRFSQSKVLCMSPEMQLISVYKKLYSPYGSRDNTTYTELIAREDKLFSLLFDKVNGGATATKKVLRVSSRDIIKINKLVLESFAAGISGDNIIVGDYAMDTIDNGRLQILSSSNIGALSKIVENSIKIVMGRNYNMNKVKYDITLPIDFQLHKYTFYIKFNGDQYALLDVFNSVQYEMIPFVMKKTLGHRVKVANLFVQLRFKFIDLYTAKLILNIGTANSNFMNKKIASLLNQIYSLRMDMREQLEKDATVLFQLDNYNGIFEEDNIVRKKLMAKEKNYFSKYYPAVVKERALKKTK